MSARDTQPPVAISTESSGLDTARIKADFPILEQKIGEYSLVYLDNAASSQKPDVVINALVDYYHNTNANIHRGLHTLSARATEAYERTREHTARFIGNVDPREIIFTSGTTDAINMIAYSWGDEHIREGDEILITEMEHHANFVPWFMLAKRKKALLKRIPITEAGYLDMSSISSLIGSRTRLVAISHMSNVLGTINPIAEITQLAREKGAITVIDGAQAAPHMPIDMSNLGADFYLFSSHKMLGPTGVGVLYGRLELLESMPPFITGGEMIQEVSMERVTWADLPYKFEAGTPNIAGVIVFDTALAYLERLGMENVRQHEMELTGYALEKLSSLDQLEIQGPLDPADRGGAISFTYPKIHPHDISTFLDSRGIAIRAGHHCAQPLMQVLGKNATARASLYIYNDRADIDILVDALTDMRKFFGV